MLYRFMLISLLCAHGLALTGCATNPVTGKTEFNFVGESEEISIGQQQYLPAQQSQGGLYQVDESLTAYVNEVGNRLAAVSDRALPYEFVVINDSSLNAWALPGGKIAINRGLLMQLENEAELAAVLGHEIVHAAARHGAKSVERNMLLQGAVMVTAISTNDSDYSNYIMGGAQLGAQLLTQRYGRSAELEADQYGMQYMAKAGYDPAAAISLQQKFVDYAAQQGKTSTSFIDGLFASHPPSLERVQKNESTAQLIKEQGYVDWQIGDKRYQQRLSYLNSKLPAYQAFDQARTLLGDKEIDVAISRLDRAIKLEPKEPRFYGLKADVQLDKGEFNQAISLYDQALVRDAGYYEYYLGRGISYSKAGNTARAKADLEKSNALLPTAIATNELGNLAMRSGDRSAAKEYYGQVAGSSGSQANLAKSAYIKLDLEDNPAPYFGVQSEIRDNQFYSTLTNKSGHGIGSLTVSFSATINGVARQHTRTSGPLAAGVSVGIYPGWPLTATDIVENVNVHALKVSL